MARLPENWYFFEHDVLRLITLERRTLESYLDEGSLSREDLRSLTLFVATHLKPKYRRELQSDVTLHSYTAVSEMHPIKEWHDGETTPPEPTHLNRWTSNTIEIMEAFQCSMNAVHMAKSQERLFPGDLMSVLRFGFYKARPAIKAAFVSALFNRMLINLPEPARKIH